MSEAKYWEEYDAAKKAALKMAAKAEAAQNEEERKAARMAEEIARMEKAIEGMSAEEVYGYCLKLEDDRERKHRDTNIGTLEASFLSLDQLVDSFEDPGKIQSLSDNGNGKANICASERTEAVSIALTRLSPNDRAFAQAVLEGKSWRDLRMSKSTFYRRLKNVENFFSPIKQG